VIQESPNTIVKTVRWANGWPNNASNSNYSKRHDSKLVYGVVGPLIWGDSFGLVLVCLTLYPLFVCLFFVCPGWHSSFLTPDRLEKLNGIGFVWSVRGETIDDGLIPETISFTKKEEVEVEVKEENVELNEEKGELKEASDEMKEGKDELKEETEELKEGTDGLKEVKDELKDMEDELKVEPIENSVSL
jgi:hypothetical protein